MLRHQTALARFGEVALTSDTLDDLLLKACRSVHDALTIDLAAVWELQRDGTRQLLRGKIGDDANLLEPLAVMAYADKANIGSTDAGTVMRADLVEVSRGLPQVPLSGLYSEAPWGSGGTVVQLAVLGGAGRPPFGVFQTYCRGIRQFTVTEIDFLRSHTGLIAAAIDRLRNNNFEMGRGERLRLALEVGEMGTMEIDLFSGNVTRTARHDHIFGYAEPPAKWTYHKLMQHVVAEDRDRVNDSFCRSVDTLAEWRCEFRIERVNDRTIRWVEARGRPLGHDHDPPSHLIGVLADITERKQAQQSLQRSNELLEARLKAQQSQQEIEARFRFATQAGRLGAWELDMRTGELITSEVCREHFGHGRADALGYLAMLESIHPEDRNRISDAIEHCAATGAEFDSECRVIRANGAPGWVEMRGQSVPTKNPVATDGRSMRMAGISLDITERVQSEQRIRQSQRVEAVGRLTAGVAHDFNNVLQVLLGGLELSLEEAQDRPDLRANLELAFQAGQRGARLTSHLLSFSRQQVLHPTPLPLLRLLRELARTLERTLGRDIVVRLTVAPGLPLVSADASHLDSALLNLALNARDAMPHGGELRIDASEKERQVVIAVSDTGEGMGPEVLGHACEPFFSTKGAAGSGLGLSMAQGFASQSGGELRIESKVGEGTRVEIWLPIAATAEPVLAGERTAPCSRGSVLVVDDDADVARVTAVFMRKAGFEVTSVGSSNQALSELCQGFRFDALVTDFAMPGMNGTDLILEAREIHRDLPALVITGYAGAEGLERLPPDVTILRKPFQRDRLLDSVRTMVARKSRATPAPA
jgi:PAS domain S-box-containing protein